jgi:hypothetical protein
MLGGKENKSARTETHKVYRSPNISKRLEFLKVQERQAVTRVRAEWPNHTNILFNRCEKEQRSVALSNIYILWQFPVAPKRFY